MSVVKQIIKDIYYTVMVKLGVIGRRRRSSANGSIVILMYHRVNPDADVLGLSVSPTFFDKQMQYLNNRYVIVSLSEAVNIIDSGRIDKNYAVITFDDGYRDNYDYAFTVLKKYNIKATIFITVNAVNDGIISWHTLDQAILGSCDKILDLSRYGLGVVSIGTRDKKELAIASIHSKLKQCGHETRIMIEAYIAKMLGNNIPSERVMLSWDEAREMQESGLITIASHTMTHPILTRVDRDTASHEINCSKAFIEERLGRIVDLFAYPNGQVGDFDDVVVKILEQAGYRAACTTMHGLVGLGGNLFKLPRIDVTYGMCRGIGGRFSREMFEAVLRG